MTKKNETVSNETTEKTKNVTDSSNPADGKVSGEKNAPEINPDVQKQMDDQAKAIADLETELKEVKKERDTLKKSSEANAKELEKLKNKEDFESKYAELQDEFNAYKEEHQKSIDENSAATIEKRQSGQKLINARESIDSLVSKFSKDIKELLK